MKNKEMKFPQIEKSLTDFLNDEDGNITRNKLVSIGSLILLMSILSLDNVFAAHSSHSSHRSHSSHESHSSTAYIRDHTNHGSHSDHSSHSDHGSHSSHSSHTSHSNTSSHSNSAYSEEGDVTYGPKVTEIPKVAVAPVDNVELLGIEDQVTADNAQEATTSILNMDLPEVPEADNIASTGDTGLEFDNSDAVDTIGSLATLGGVGAIAASGIGAIKFGIDTAREKSRIKKLKASAGMYFDEYTDDSIEKKINELKEAADLETNKTILKQLESEEVIEYSKIPVAECIEKLENLQKALENNPSQRDSAERFANYYIPETIGIVMTFVQYVNDNAPEDDMNIVFEKAMESINALNDALDEKVDNIYQYTTMDTIAKADALNDILSHNGYTNK